MCQHIMKLTISQNIFICLDIIQVEYRNQMAKFSYNNNNNNNNNN